MKKKIFIILGIVVICLLFVFVPSQLKQKKTNPENIVDYLKDFKSYSTNMDIEIKNDKQKINFKCKQVYKKGLGYRLKLNNDRILVYKDDRIYVTDLQNGQFYNTNSDFDEVYKLGFIEEYIKLLYTDEKIKYTTKNEKQNEYLLIELIVPCNNKNIHKAVMWVDKKSKRPYKSIIYDVDSKETISIKYYNFQSNIQVDSNLFKITKTKEN